MAFFTKSQPKYKISFRESINFFKNNPRFDTFRILAFNIGAQTLALSVRVPLDTHRTLSKFQPWGLQMNPFSSMILI